MIGVRITINGGVCKDNGVAGQAGIAAQDYPLAITSKQHLKEKDDEDDDCSSLGRDDRLFDGLCTDQLPAHRWKYLRE